MVAQFAKEVHTRSTSAFAAQQRGLSWFLKVERRTQGNKGLRKSKFYRQSRFQRSKLSFAPICGALIARSVGDSLYFWYISRSHQNLRSRKSSTTTSESRCPRSVYSGTMATLSKSVVKDPVLRKYRPPPGFPHGTVPIWPRRGTPASPSLSLFPIGRGASRYHMGTLNENRLSGRPTPNFKRPLS